MPDESAPKTPAAPRAVLDACVLYPDPLRDLFLHAAVLGVYQARWSADIHEEWMRNVLENRPDLSRERLERTRRMVDAHAEGCLVEDYAHRIPGLVLPDPDDRHVLAAAIEAEAPMIVTFNVRDFPTADLAPHGVAAVRPDGFLCGLFDQDPPTICEAVRNQRALLLKPPKTVEEHLATLAQNGLPNLTARLRPHAAEL